MSEPFNADRITLEDWDIFLKCIKKPIVVHAVQIIHPGGFTVTTMEGKLTGKPGDYLMVGANGEKYPIDREIFKKTYDIIKEEE